MKEMQVKALRPSDLDDSADSRRRRAERKKDGLQEVAVSRIEAAIAAHAKRIAGRERAAATRRQRQEQGKKT